MDDKYWDLSVGFWLGVMVFSLISIVLFLFSFDVLRFAWLFFGVSLIAIIVYTFLLFRRYNGKIVKG